MVKKQTLCVSDRMTNFGNEFCTVLVIFFPIDKVTKPVDSNDYCVTALESGIT